MYFNQAGRTEFELFPIKFHGSRAEPGVSVNKGSDETLAPMGAAVGAALVNPHRYGGCPDIGVGHRWGQTGGLGHQCRLKGADRPSVYVQVSQERDVDFLKSI